MRAALLVFAGGAVGSLARFGLAEAWTTTSAWPWATFAVNVVGSLALGVLVARVVDPLDPWRLLLGTGALGGFTTYSAFAVEADLLIREDRALVALVYVTGSVVLGVAAAALGVLAARRPA